MLPSGSYLVDVEYQAKGIASLAVEYEYDRYEYALTDDVALRAGDSRKSFEITVDGKNGAHPSLLLLLFYATVAKQTALFEMVTAKQDFTALTPSYRTACTRSSLPHTHSLSLKSLQCCLSV